MKNSNSTTTVTIGIPAYNEESNIGILLRSLLDQETDQFKLSEIIVNSDGSNDSTDDIVESFHSKKIRLIRNRDRRGVAVRQNEILSQSNTDILIILNADVYISDSHFIKKIIIPIVHDKVDLVSTKLECVTPSTMMGRILETSVRMRTHLYEKYRYGNNLYTCHGAARAFSKSIYKQINFKSGVGEDAYSYLYCISHNYRYKYVGNATIYIRWAESWKDHYSQSTRFFKTKNILSKYFSSDLVASEYKLPIHEIVKSIVSFFLKNPFYSLMYGIIFVTTYLVSHVAKTSDTWVVATSSKRIT